MSDWQDFSYTTTDGLKLAGRKYGWQHTKAIPLVCLSGLNRNSAEFDEIAQHIAASETPRRVLTLDYRGRGQSDHDKNFENYNIITESEDVIQGITAAGLGHINILGASRGGLIALLMGAMRPGIINSIIFNDIGPVIDGVGLMRMKRNLEMGSDYPNWNSAIDLYKSTRKGQYPNADDAFWDRATRKIYKEVEGKIVRNYDPALLKTISAIDINTRLPEMWDQFIGISKIPSLLIRGTKSDMLLDATVAKMQELHTNLDCVEVENQGHTPDLAMGDLPAKIIAFLKENDH